MNGSSHGRHEGAPTPTGSRESAAAKKLRAAAIAERLAVAHPAAECSLAFDNPFQLLVATILSAQCTDKRVNMVTGDLFRRWPTPAALAAARPRDLEGVIRSTGFYRAKAKNILGCCQSLVERYGGQVPTSLSDLVRLPGVGRKTANVVLGGAFGQAEGIVVDTHVGRIARRLGAAAWLLGAGALAAASLPDEVNSLLAAGRTAEALQRSEQALMVSPRDAQARFVHGVVLMELRRDAEAMEQFERLAQEFPELPEPLNNIALLHARAGRLDTARLTLESALRNDPGHRAARANLAEVHLMLAVAAWEQLARTGPLDPRQSRRLEAVRALLAPAAR